VPQSNDNLIFPHPRPSPATELSAHGQAARAGEGGRAAPMNRLPTDPSPAGRGWPKAGRGAAWSAAKTSESEDFQLAQGRRNAATLGLCPNPGSSLKGMSNQAAQDVPRAINVFHASTHGMRMPPFAREPRQPTADVDVVNRRGACAWRCRQSLQD
jgi:hypothetical protein